MQGGKLGLGESNFSESPSCLYVDLYRWRATVAQPKVETVKGRQSGPGNLKGVMCNHVKMLSSNGRISKIK